MSYAIDRAKKLRLPVEDGKNPLVITVTNNDVVNAIKSDSKRCALSRAAERMPGVIHAYFFRTRAYLEFKDRMVSYILPPSVQKEIVSFDRAKIFAAGVYQLTPPGNLRTRLKNRDRSKDVQRERDRRKTTARPSRRDPKLTADRMPSYSANLKSGDPNAAEFMEKMAAATQLALTGKGNCAGVRRATKQPTSAHRMTLVNHTKYVRDMNDPDAFKRTA